VTTLVDDLATWHAAGSPPIGTPNPGEGTETMWRCVLGAWHGTMERREARLTEEEAQGKAGGRKCGPQTKLH
jgi:hypothetical protein